MSSRNSSKHIVILTEAQREAITQSPARMEIMDAMSDIAPCSIAELAAELGRSPQSLYYHAEIMVKAGLMRQVGVRKAGKRDEAVYEMTAEHFRLSGNQDPRRHETLLRFNATVLRMSERDYRKAIEGGLVRRIRKHENIYTRRQRGWLTDEALEKIYGHLEAIGEILAQGNKKKEGQAYGLTIALSPLMPEK